VNIFLALLASFAFVFVYWTLARRWSSSRLARTRQRLRFEERVAWTLVGSLSGEWVVVFGVFLLLMKKEYTG